MCLFSAYAFCHYVGDDWMEPLAASCTSVKPGYPLQVSVPFPCLSRNLFCLVFFLVYVFYRFDYLLPRRFVHPAGGPSGSPRAPGGMIFSPLSFSVSLCLSLSLSEPKFPSQSYPCFFLQFKVSPEGEPERFLGDISEKELVKFSLDM